MEQILHQKATKRQFNHDSQILNCGLHTIALKDPKCLPDYGLEWL